MNNKAGAVIERARRAEEVLVTRIDMEQGNPTSAGEGIEHTSVGTFPELVRFCISSGWSAFYRGHHITLTRGCGMGGTIGGEKE